MKKIVACLKKEKNQIIIFMFLIFISILLLNIFTPLIADDYGYLLVLMVVYTVLLML